MDQRTKGPEDQGPRTVRFKYHKIWKGSNSKHPTSAENIGIYILNPMQLSKAVQSASRIFQRFSECPPPSRPGLWWSQSHAWPLRAWSSECINWTYWAVNFGQFYREETKNITLLSAAKNSCNSRTATVPTFGIYAQFGLGNSAEVC